MILPLGMPTISLRSGTSGALTVRPQRPARPRRVIGMSSPWTRALQELDEIISDAAAWGVSNARVIAPVHSEIGAISLTSETTVVAALRAERASLVQWRQLEIPSAVTLERLVLGNTDHLLTPLSLDALLAAGAELHMSVVAPGADFSMHVRNDSREDREFLFTWFCDV